MSNLPLKALKWVDESDADVKHTAQSALHNYTIQNSEVGKKYEVKYESRRGVKYRSKPATGFATIEEAKQWAWNHYNEKMQPYVKPDSITDIANWFKAAKPEPTAKDALVQQGCHFEEVVEHLTSIGIESEDLCDLSNDLKSNTRLQTDDAIANYMDTIDNLELLDALCDQIVTATGVAYMMGFDIEGALKEVVRSNNSKMVDGKFTFDDNGKIMKPDSYSEPDLKPFISTTQNLHKGD